MYFFILLSKLGKKTASNCCWYYRSIQGFTEYQTYQHNTGNLGPEYLFKISHFLLSSSIVKPALISPNLLLANQSCLMLPSLTTNQIVEVEILFQIEFIIIVLVRGTCSKIIEEKKSSVQWIAVISFHRLLYQPFWDDK